MLAVADNRQAPGFPLAHDSAIEQANQFIIDRDFFEVPAAEIDDIHVLETWVGGKRVYSAAEEAPR